MTNTLTITGRLTADPEITYRPDGTAVAGFTIAHNHRRKNPAGEWSDDGTTFIRCTAWRHTAEACAESLRRADLVTVVGSIKLREYEHQGQQRKSLDMTVDTIAKNVRLARREMSAATNWGGEDREDPPF